MQHAHTIAIARRLLAEGRPAEVARMIEPLLASGNGDGTPAEHDAGEAVLRSLLARIRLLRDGDAMRAGALLRPYATVEAVRHLPTTARMEVLLWRGWLHAWPDHRTQRLPEALALLTEAETLCATRHDALSRYWALLGQAACYLALDEAAQLQRLLDAADAAVHPVPDVQARLIRISLHLGAACLRGETSHTLADAECLIQLGRTHHDPMAEGQGRAYRALVLLGQDAAPDEVLAEAREAATLLTHSSVVHPGPALLHAVEAQASALLRIDRPDEAQRLLDRSARMLEQIPGAAAWLTHLRARIALYEERGEDAVQLCREAHARLPHPQSPRKLARLLLTQAEATLAAGDAQRARHLATQAFRKASTVDDRDLVHQAETIMARLPSSDPGSDGAAASAPASATDAAPLALVYASPSMQAVAEAARQAARSYHAVLITGERGSGKERLARAVHAHSVRHAQPFVVFDSTTMPSDVVARTLVGGSPRDTGTGRDGALYRAQGGTLFINEVADLPRDVQAMLAHALDEGAIVPPGGRTSVPIDVRLIAATSRNLPAGVEAGTFDAGLYTRLQIIPLHLPPLRDRRDDIPLLAYHVLGTLQPKGAPLVALTDRALDALTQYDWPGNLRQLRNELERALAQIRSEPAPVIDREHLSPLLRDAASPALQQEADALEVTIRPGLSLDALLGQAEKTIIERVLAEHEGHVSASAQALGLTRQGLYKKMKRLDIDPSTFPSSDAVTAS